MKNKIRSRILLFFVLAILFPLSPWLGCNSGANPLPVATGLLYALDRVNLAVYVLDNINSLNGAVDPVRTISGGNTLIENPTAITVDGRGDILYVADQTAQQILAFPTASTTGGDIAPLRTFPGITRAVALFYDLEGDVLYAADILLGTVVAWDGIRSLTTGTAPNRTIVLGYNPSSLFVDTQRDLLYVGDPSTQSVNRYKNASTLSVTSPFPPDALINDADAPLTNINSIALNDPNNILFMAESANPSVVMFDSASTISGSLTPDRNLEGSNTTLTIHMSQILFLENILYAILSNISTSIGVWDSANTLDGDVAPNRTITVNGAAEINGFAIDLAH